MPNDTCPECEAVLMGKEQLFCDRCWDDILENLIKQDQGYADKFHSRSADRLGRFIYELMIVLGDMEAASRTSLKTRSQQGTCQETLRA